VTAQSEGAWGNDLFIGVVHPDATDNTAFGLTVREYDGDRLVATENYHSVNTTTGDSGNIATVVNAASDLVEVRVDAAGTRPASSQAAVAATNGAKLDDIGKPVLARFAGGSDGVTPGSAVWKSMASGAIVGNEVDGSGMFALHRIAPDIFNIMCIPAAAELDEAGTSAVYAAALEYCKDKRAFLIVDPPAGMNTSEGVRGWGGLPRDGNAAVYFPRLSIGDALNANEPRELASSGTMAGIFARTDADRGVWKAPAGPATGLRGADLRLTRVLTGAENGVLNAEGVNALRSFPRYGNVCWGSRTLAGTHAMVSEWKYVPVRRTALFIEGTLTQGLQWVVFEPNGEPLWSQIRLSVSDFLDGLFRKGAFQGAKPSDAYFVKVDGGTTTRADIEAGVVNIVVGFAPLKPAEFIVIKIAQRAGRSRT
ncbi:MAG: phage tail sheath subtilisin-like domain-containing protein, partial [Actinomycetota bacterium]|nr:phage tail sheath subtilisin-like domain-containing protein [Actinomycetota bacterium]